MAPLEFAFGIQHARCQAVFPGGAGKKLQGINPQCTLSLRHTSPGANNLLLVIAGFLSII